jgi:diacylglycerol kinase family enzyme
MRKQYYRKPRSRTRRIYNIVTNRSAPDYSPKIIGFLQKEIERSGGQYFISEPESSRELVAKVRNIVSKKPDGLIVCGGDGTVSLAARYLARRMIKLGIIPLGRFNNIYRSLYGSPDIKKAVGHIIFGGEKKIDSATVSGHFFLGSIGLGLLPEMLQILENKRTPRFGIGWSRLAALASAEVEVKPLTLKMDEFQFDLSPRTISFSLLPYSVGLPLTPASLVDDGKCEVVFDVDQTKAIMSGFIRAIFKRKYIYSDEVRMFRGRRISLSPVEGDTMYIDGELIPCPASELNIEIQEKRIRIFYDSRG